MKSLKDLLQQSKQKTYMLGQAFAEGTWVENTNGEVGKIHRRGVNYIIAVTNIISIIVSKISLIT